MRYWILRLAVPTTFVMPCVSASASAQTKAEGPKVLLMPQMHYGAPLRSAAGAMRSAPRRASAESTYLGLEGGFGFPVYGWGDSILSVRPGIGITRRIDGIGTWSDRATFTWNVGASLMLPTAWFASGR